MSFLPLVADAIEWTQAIRTTKETGSRWWDKDIVDYWES